MTDSPATAAVDPVDTVDPDRQRRLDIARRNRLREVKAKDHRLAMFVFAACVYCAFTNLLFGGIALLGGNLLFGPIWQGIGIAYAWVAWTTWVKGHAPWWQVLIPIGVNIAFGAVLFAFFKAPPAPVAALINLALLIAIPLKVRSHRVLTAALAA